MNEHLTTLPRQRRMRRELPLAVADYDAALRQDVSDVIRALAAAPLTEGEVGTPAGAEHGTGTRALPESAPFLLGLYGIRRSGKDMAADYLAAEYAGVVRMAFSDVIMAEANAYLAPFGHVITKENKVLPHYLALLQLWGVGRRAENPNYWTEKIAQAARDFAAQGTRLLIVTGERAKTDYEVIRAEGGHNWKVRRPGLIVDNGTSNAAGRIEGQLEDLPDAAWHAIIDNDVEGDLAPYFARVESAIQAA